MRASTLGATPVEREFNANLLDRIGSTVFMRGFWVPFDSVTINRAFKLNDENSEEFKTMFGEHNSNRILNGLRNGEIAWKRGSSNEVICFLRTNLNHTTKAWF